MELLKSQIRSFMARDYEVDIRELNAGILRSGQSDAGIKMAPPSVLTGDPFSLQPTHCVCVMGLNPKWHDTIEREINLLKSEVRENRFDDYLKRRATYFDDNSIEYYGRYFTRLGNLLRKCPLEIEAASARALFRNHVLKLDLLPWWSSNVGRIDPGALSSSLDSLIAWQTLLECFLKTLRPRVIIVNGSGFREFVTKLIAVDLREFRYAGNRRAFQGKSGISGADVLVHGQVNAVAGPGTDALYRDLITTWCSLT